MATSVTVRDERLLIGGAWVESQTGRRFDVTDPATGEVVGSVPDADADDVRRAVDAAEAALPAWRATPAVERSRVLRRAADLLLERAEAIGALMTAEQGKPLAEAKGEVAYAAGFLEWFSGEAERVYGQVVPSRGPDKRILVLRRPVGVTAALTPWNFPAAMLTRKLGPALAAGCTSVAKPAELTPLTAVEVCRALIDAGLPDGVVNLLTTETPAVVSRALLGDRRVRKLSFTGSTPVGKELMRLAADNLTRLSLELGGHAPFIIFDDADLGPAVDSLVASKFRNAGQTCVCANRVYVQRGVYPEVVERLARAVTALEVGRGTRPGVQIGPLIHDRALRKADDHVQDAVAHGARVVVGGHRLTDGELAAGHFYAPTVLADVTPTMLLSREETFGPVAGLQPFDTEAEAVALANDTVYGLAAYFHTRDYARLLRVAEQLEYGIVGANDGMPSTPNAPFGGVKESGIGREGGSTGIDEYLDVKYLSIGGVAPA
jgi:succinate-semialdehyde dehydrogenase/glutarate-semialdehyde dehydrogenase